jgi:hypothetical protein
MTKKTRYEPRVFDGRIIHSAEIERIHKEVLDFERIEAISDPNARADRGPVAGAGEQAPTEGHLTPIASSILGQGRRPRRAAGNGNKKAKHPNCAGGEVRCVRQGQYRAGGEVRRVR